MRQIIATTDTLSTCYETTNSSRSQSKAAEELLAAIGATCKEISIERNGIKESRVELELLNNLGANSKSANTSETDQTDTKLSLEDLDIIKTIGKFYLIYALFTVTVFAVENIY